MSGLRAEDTGQTLYMMLENYMHLASLVRSPASPYQGFGSIVCFGVRSGKFGPHLVVIRDQLGSAPRTIYDARNQTCMQNLHSGSQGSLSLVSLTPFWVQSLTCVEEMLETLHLPTLISCDHWATWLLEKLVFPQTPLAQPGNGHPSLLLPRYAAFPSARGFLASKLHGFLLGARALIMQVTEE